MRNKLLTLFVFIILWGCQPSSNSEYFKLTITDESEPVGLLPEYIEVSSDGKLIILTNRFNEGDEIYQQTYFIELNKIQLDSVRFLVGYLANTNIFETLDNALNYKIKLDLIEKGQHKSRIFIGNDSNVKFSNLINFCKNLPEQNKRYSLKQSYYFNTDEICLQKMTE